MLLLPGVRNFFLVDDETKSIEKIIDNSGKGGNVQAELMMKFEEKWNKINCDIDTGAEVCIIGYDFWKEMTKKKMLEKSSYKLKSVTGEVIEVCGRTTIPVRYKKKTCSEFDFK